MQVSDSELPPMTATGQLSITVDANTPPSISSISPAAGALNGGAVDVSVSGSLAFNHRLCRAGGMRSA